jgi:hypothetical protein
MSVYEGGLLDRVVFDSFVRMVRESLDQLGWFDVAASGRTPLTLLTTPVEFHDEIPTNAAIIQFEDHYDDPGEIGSTLTFDRTMAWVDIYPESLALGRHLAGDVRDILRGKMPSIGRDDPSFEVLDLPGGVDPPPVLFLVDITDVEIHREPKPSTTPGRFWVSVSALLEEERA